MYVYVYIYIYIYIPLNTLHYDVYIHISANAMGYPTYYIYIYVIYLGISCSENGWLEKNKCKIITRHSVP